MFKVTFPEGLIVLVCALGLIYLLVAQTLVSLATLVAAVFGVLAYCKMQKKLGKSCCGSAAAAAPAEPTPADAVVEEAAKGKGKK